MAQGEDFVAAEQRHLFQSKKQEDTGGERAEQAHWTADNRSMCKAKNLVSIPALVSVSCLYSRQISK